MTVLVTGAAGFLGGHVIDALRARGTAVRALVLPSEPEASVARLAAVGAEVVRGDLRDRDSVAAAVRGVRAVINSAGRTGPWGPRSEYEAVNVRGLMTLLDLALAGGARRLVHVSSGIVVGTDVGGTADEDAPLRLEPNPYSWSKIQAERLLRREIRERAAPVTIVRPGLLYGPRDAGSFGRFAALVETGRMVMIGSGDNDIPLSYVVDVAEGIGRAVDAPAAVGRTYFLTSPPVTQRAYLEAISAALGVAPLFRRIPYRSALALALVAESATRLLRRPGPPALTRFGVGLLGGNTRLPYDRARADLGYDPQVGLEEGVARGIEWYRGEGTPGAARRRAPA
jgi:nucleoside-diphosphate-sugar epimerase